MSITLYNWEEFERRARRLIGDFDQRKGKLLIKLGRIYQGEVKRLITEVGAVDTGRLRSSIVVEKINDSTVMVGTNVEYAKWVNDGHRQKQRFVPGRWRDNGTFEYLPRSVAGGQGMMLTERFIPGRKFMEKGIYRAKPKQVAAIEEFMEELRREWEG